MTVIPIVAVGTIFKEKRLMELEIKKIDGKNPDHLEDNIVEIGWNTQKSLEMTSVLKF